MNWLQTIKLQLFSCLQVYKVAICATSFAKFLSCIATLVMYRHAGNRSHRRKCGAQNLQLVGRDQTLRMRFAQSGAVVPVASCQWYSWLHGRRNVVARPSNQLSHLIFGVLSVHGRQFHFCELLIASCAKVACYLKSS